MTMQTSTQKNIQNLITEVIKSRRAKKIMLQLPEGLKMNAAEIIDTLRENNIEAVLSGDASFGACDIKDREAKQAGCDLLVHVGHNKFYRDFDTAVPVLYFPWMIDAVIDKIDFSGINEHKIGLVTSVQHLHMLDEVSKRLESASKEAVIGGQVLGCWTVNAERIKNDVDAFLFVGSGVFHPLGIETDKKVYVLDLETQKIRSVDMSLLEKKRYANIYNAKDAETFAILVSTKSGQRDLTGNAEKIASYLRERDKKALILVMDEIKDEKLLGIKVDAFINTACPRLMDDEWSKPFINANDVEKLFEDE